MDNKVKIPCGGFVLGEGLALGEDGKTLNVTGGDSQADWNQNDSTAADYVKNRPFYTGDPVETVLVEENTVSFTDNSGLYGANFPISFNAEFGQTYKVSWDGTSYECVCENYSNAPLIGNQSIMGLGSDTGEPFLIFNESGLNETGWASLAADTSASHTISISGMVAPVAKIDEKYLPPISKQVVYDLSKAVFKEGEKIYYFVDPTTLTDILKSINTGSQMPYIGLKAISQQSQPAFLVNVCINFSWGISMDAEAVTVVGMMSSTVSVNVYIFDTFEHAKAYYER